MDARAARALVRAVGQLLTAIDDDGEVDLPDENGQDLAEAGGDVACLLVGQPELERRQRAGLEGHHRCPMRTATRRSPCST
jgi:hypothetical protein